MNARALRALETLFENRQVITDPAELITYELDAGFDRGMPDALVFPHTTAEVARLAAWAMEHDVPLIARGAGTGLAGGAVATEGGVIVNFAHMKRIRSLDTDVHSAIVEAGVVNLEFDERLKRYDLYYPPDPASQRASTIGGNVATNAGGPHCFKYGVTTNYVTGMEVVLADGRVVTLGGRVVDAPEYDLHGIVCGSEGTLALVTAIRVHLVPRPSAIKTMTATFDSVAQACKAVSAVIGAGLVPATLELMDRQMIRIVEPFAQAGLPTDAGALLLVEVDGYATGLDAQMDRVSAVLRQHGGQQFRIAVTEEERAALWRARKSIAGALSRLAPKYYLVDITVPRSRLAETLTDVDDVCDRYGVRVGHVMHAGDGNLHPLLLITDPDDPEHVATVYQAGLEIAELCVEKDGSLSGEHGIGTEKRTYMPRMFTDAELTAMWDVKQVFDPQQRFNPGKVFPEEMPESVSVRTSGAPPDTPFRPATPEEVAEGLTALSHAERPVYVGEQTATFAGKDATVLSTRALTGIGTYAPDDLYVTVGAGTSVAELHSFLADEGLQASLAAPWPEATVGGLVAANVNAPLRLRYGALRDVVLCATVALADGRLIRTGRPLVKNVAGYDLTKVVVGSYGTLGVLTDVTLKLTPVPQTQRTLLVPLDELVRGLEWAAALRAHTFVASALILCTGGRQRDLPDSRYLLGYTAEGWSDDVQAELDGVRDTLARLGAPTPREVSNVSGTDIWRDVLARANEQTLLLRAGVPPASLRAAVADQAAPLGIGDVVVDVPHGLVYAAARHGDASAAEDWLGTLRRSARVHDGYTIVVDAPAAWMPALDCWGYRPDTLDLMQNLKARWDPAGILNPGYLW